MPNQPAYVKQQPQEPYQLPSGRWIVLRKAFPRLRAARISSARWSGKASPKRASAPLDAYV